MPHPYTITTPDPDLPLIDTRIHETFAAKKNGKLHGGSIYPQLLEAGGTSRHPRLFYIEFPAASGKFHEISLLKLTSILGDGGSARHFTVRDAARLISAIPRSHDFPKLLKAAAP